MTLKDILEQAVTTLEQVLDDLPVRPRVRETGTVIETGGGIARIRGLPSARSEELVEFEGGLPGVVIDLEPREIGVMLLGDPEGIRAGMEVRVAGRLADVPVGEGLLGRVLDATGRVLDEKGRLAATERRCVERDAPAIMDRAPVTEPLQTGFKSIDALIPIGKGQRELIVGDRQTGKTTIAVDIMLNQVGRNVICIYCAIGQRGTAVARVVEMLRIHGALEHSVVVVAAGEDPPGLQYLTPYAATAMGEYFMEQGRDVLIVYDDLTRHARAYREISLLLRRPPGREAYPGDIFFIHSRLLERATHLREVAGGGSMTALPIVETQAEDIAAYIPTNLISITDGQIYVSPRLFRKGHLPAIDIGRSVSRVGGKAQLPPYHVVAGELRLAYSQFEELETFARFSTRLDERTRATIERGRRVREVLKQAEHEPVPVSEQLAVLKAAVAGLLDDVALEHVAAAERAIRTAVHEQLGEHCRRLDRGMDLGRSDWDAMLDCARRAASGHYDG